MKAHNDTVIHKQILPTDKRFFSLPMSPPITIIDVQEQNGNFTMWYSRPADEKFVRAEYFRWIQTGEDFPNKYKECVKTIQLTNGLVFHLFKYTSKFQWDLEQE